VDAPAFAEYLNECIADTSHALSATVSAKLIFGGTPVSARPNSQPDSAMVAAAALMEAAVRSISSTGALKSSKRIRSSKSSSAAYNQSETQLQDMPVAHQRARHPVIESQDFVGPPALMPMQVSGVIPTVEFDDPDVVAEHAPSDEDPNGASKALLRISLTSPPPVAVPKSSGTQLDIVEMMPCLWCASAVLDNNPERQRIAAIAADACNAASNHNTNGDMHVESQSNMWSQLDMPIPMPSLKRKANAIVSSKEREQREASAAAQVCSIISDLLNSLVLICMYFDSESGVANGSACIGAHSCLLRVWCMRSSRLFQLLQVASGRHARWTRRRSL
jgi:hypothetical protein